MKQHFLFLAALCCISYRADAQNFDSKAINTAGGSGTLAGHTFEWSVGEMALVHTGSNASLVVTQGLLQPFGIYPAGVRETNADAFGISVYPNPSTGLVYMVLRQTDPGDVDIQLLDVTGKRCLAQPVRGIQGDRISVDINGYAVGVYLMAVSIKSGGAPVTLMYKIEKI